MNDDGGLDSFPVPTDESPSSACRHNGKIIRDILIGQQIPSPTNLASLIIHMYISSIIACLLDIGCLQITVDTIVLHNSNNNSNYSDWRINI